ncbi:ADP-ribosylation factor-like protein 13B [Eleutherodactylus coqui]|uniref:ADP-ribosylation factor-like protein 13B n=1 Tax=Eleutherodactylus coqui TaxID=57060 RepID=UPI003461B474
MFHLFSHCWRWIQIRQEPIRSATILFLGLENAGKSSIIKVIKRVPPCGHMSSSNEPFRTELHFEQFELTLLELPSGQKMRANWRLYYPHAHALVFVVDASDHGHIQEVAGVLSTVLKHPRVAGKPLLIFANKQDRASALLSSEIIELLSLEKLVNENRTLCKIEPCSASADFHDWAILRSLRWVLRSVAINYSALSARILQDSAEQKESIHHRITVRPQNHSDLLGWDMPQESITELVEYKPFPGCKKRSLKPIQSMLTQPRQKLHSINKKRKRKVKGVENTPPQVLKVNPNEDRDQRIEVKASTSSGAQVCSTLGHRAAIMPDTQDDPHATSAGPKKRKKKKKPLLKKQSKSLETAARTGDIENTFDLYRKAMHALKLKQEQRNKTSLGNQGVSPLQ